MKSICIYCGASDNVDQKYLDAAFQMGIAAAERGIQVIYGGGSTGMMGAVANGALSVGGDVIGIIPKFFHTKEKAHASLTHIEIVDSMHQRKARMAELAEGFIALPGGVGTFEELFEVLTWLQIGLHNKPIGLLNTHQYYDTLISFLKQVEEKGFTHSKLHKLYYVADSPDELLDIFVDHEHPENMGR